MLSPVTPAPEFTLQGSDGKPLSLARYRGKVVLLAFGFTSCGEVCPITLATLAGARKKLGAAGANVQVVYVTVDPERDDAARMRKFLGASIRASSAAPARARSSTRRRRATASAPRKNRSTPTATTPSAIRPPST